MMFRFLRKFWPYLLILACCVWLAAPRHSAALRDCGLFALGALVGVLLTAQSPLFEAASHKELEAEWTKLCAAYNIAKIRLDKHL